MTQTQAPPLNVLRVGDPIMNRRQLEMLPVNATINEANSARRVWTKIGDDLWDFRGSRYRNADLTMGGANVLHSLPGGGTTFEIPRQTVEQFKWNFRQGATAAAESHGVGRETLRKTLTDMGAYADVPLGRGVKIAQDMRNDLPDGSVVYSGTPENVNGFGVFVKKDGRWSHVIGENVHMQNEQVIESIAGDRTEPDWLTRPGTPEDDEAIAAFKAAAWRVGWKLKRASGWCSTYEHIVYGLGISEEDARRAQTGGYRIESVVATDDIANLPAGSLLSWASSTHPDEFALFIRRDAMTNKTRTEKVLSIPADKKVGNYMNSGMVLQHTPMNTTDLQELGGGGGYLMPRIEQTWSLLPPGTCFTYARGGAQVFMICRDGQAVDANRYVTNGYRDMDIPATGPHPLSAFSENPAVRIVRMPF